MSFAAGSTPTDDLAGFFLADTYYTDTDSSAAFLRTFIGNHDVGRLGWQVDILNPGADDSERVSSPWLMAPFAS